LADPEPTCSSSFAGRLVIVDITSAAELELMTGGAGVVAHLYARNATTSSAITPIVAAAGSHVGVRDTGFRMGRVRLAVLRWDTRTPW
jgi:hypothetical protein